MLLREHIQKQRDTFALDSQSLPIPKTSDLLKSIERIESVMSVSSDKSASITISNELSFLKKHLMGATQFNLFFYLRKSRTFEGVRRMSEATDRPTRTEKPQISKQNFSSPNLRPQMLSPLI